MLRSKKTKSDDSVPKAAGGHAPSPEGVNPSAPAAPPMPTTDDVEALKAKAAQMEEWKDKCLHVAADLDNYRKRAAREKIETTKYATQQLLTRLLPTLDSFEAALQHAAADPSPDGMKALIEGLKMTLAQFHSVLREAGVEEVNAEGQHFDPQMHEAISLLESDDHPAGKVIQQLRKGYKLSDRLLRPATVVVSKGKPQADAAQSEAPQQPGERAGENPCDS